MRKQLNFRESTLYLCGMKKKTNYHSTCQWQGWGETWLYFQEKINQKRR